MISLAGECNVKRWALRSIIVLLSYYLELLHSTLIHTMPV